MISRAFTLYQESKSKDLDFIYECIQNNTKEGQHLEFKTTEYQNYTDTSTLFPSDQKNLSKSICAFGNAEGGILVWGIETVQAHTKPQTDNASRVYPIQGLSHFYKLIQQYTPSATTPSHTDIQYHTILETYTQDTGYLIIYIPQANTSSQLTYIHNEKVVSCIRKQGVSKPVAL